MRTGNNPLKGQLAQPMPDVAAIVITHLPVTSGYHAERLEVVQTCLTSLRAHAGRDLPVLVWDNGSGPELRDWLVETYAPEWLVLSPNVGKASARSSAIRMFPPETVVCLSDDDMLFYPHWLAPQMTLLEGFPDVGVVSGYPVRTQQRWGIETTLAWARQNAVIHEGRFIPDEQEADFAVSIGRDPEWHRRYTAGEHDRLIEYRGLKALALAHHCQFIAYAGALEYLVQWDGEAVSDEKAFDRAIDRAGMLRLCTPERLVRHIGNVIHPELRAEIEGMGLWRSMTMPA